MPDNRKTVTTTPLPMVGKVSKIRCFALIYALLSIFFTGFACSSSSAEEILTPEERLWLTNNQSRIVLAVETGYAPFVFLDSKDQPTGLAHDYILLLESKLGVHFKQERFSSLDDIFKKVRSGEVHIVNAVTKTPQRSTFLAFTEPFISVPNVIVTRKDRSGQMREENLSGLRVSLVKSYAVTESLTNKNLGYAPDLVPDDLSALLSVSFGRSDAAVIDLATASYLITQKGITNLRVAGETAFDIRLSMGVPIDEPVLLSILKKGLGAVTNAERQEIHKRWINASSQSILSDWRFWAVAGGVLFIVLVAISGILIWNRTLRKQIAERKEAERKLARSEAQLRANLDHTPNVAIQWYDADGRVTYWNPASERLFGWRAEEAIGKTLDTLIFGPEEAAEFLRVLERIRESGEPYGPYEVEIHTRNGRVCWTLSTIFAIPMEDERLGFACMDVDITERKQAEAALRRTTEELQEAQRIAHMGSWRLDVATDQVTWSEELYRMFGLPPDMLPPDYPVHQKLFTPKSWDKLNEAVRSTRETGIPYELELEMIKTGDSKGWMLARGEAMRDASGAIIGLRGVALDITERKLVMQELKRSNAELEQFSYAISHDMRQPLRMISSYLQLLEKRLAGQLDGDKREFFDFAIDGAQRLDKMLLALLEYSRVGRKGEPPEWVESRALLDEALRFLQPAIAEAQAEVKIIGDWPRVFVSRDEMMRLIQNLIGNAVKYRVAGRKPEITVRSETIDKEWRLSVADNGVGILPSQIHRLFQVFQRLQTQAAYEGTGIGLALCRKIAEHHGGRIEAESAGEGQGSRFYVHLPRGQEESASTGDERRIG